MIDYDYIILGCGASGLSLINKMINDSYFSNKSILIIDKEKKDSNDKTWCYWEDGIGEWDDILTVKWDKISFKNKSFDKREDILPYQYKMIRSSDFYSKICTLIDKTSNITFLKEEVIDLIQENTFGKVVCKKNIYTSNVILNSILFSNEYNQQKRFPVLQQHFVGYFIKSKENFIDNSFATFMDFSVSQKGNTRFMYILPYNRNEALFEYTLFSEDFLKYEEYISEIENYLKEKKITNYEILEIEKGSIPMTSYKFWKQNSKNILHIGTAGGWSKASTGFTFKNIMKNSDRLITYLKSNKPLTKYHKKNRFWFYDLLLLDILSSKNYLGSDIFSRMFEKVSTKKILKFLDEETNILDEILIFSKMPKRLFLKAMINRVF